MLNIKGVFNSSLKSLKSVHRTKYFYSIAIAFVFCLATLAVLYTGSAPILSQFKEGDISLRTVYAPYDFSYPTTIDEAQTENMRMEFESKVLPVYDIDPAVQDKAFEEINNFFAIVKSIQETAALTDKEKIDLLKAQAAATDLSNKDLASFLEAKDTGLNGKTSKDVVENVFLVGIVSEQDRKALQDARQEKISLRNQRFKIEKEVVSKDLVSGKEAKAIVRDSIDRMLPKEKALKNAIYNFAQNKVNKNATLNASETAKRKQAMRDEVPPFYNRDTIKKNELIVERGKKLTKDDIVKLNQITRLHAVRNRASYLSGLLIIMLGLIIASILYHYLFEKKYFLAPKEVLLNGINAFLLILLSLVIIQSHQPTYLIPLASVGMMLTLLLCGKAACITILSLAIYIGFMAGGNLGLTFMLFLGSFVGIFAVSGARRRSQIFFAGFIVSFINFSAIAGIGLLNNFPKEAILRGGLYGVANGIISSFIVIGLLPVFEYTFNLITNITLLELSDLSHPLLKELTIKAPGTYHHSLLVGNLAEKACDAIGANSLLARVGAYYHDIGKIEKAEYFVENEMGTASKHEKLAPSMSALVITNHTKDGVEIARKHKLNDSIIDFIDQHHGTSLIYYFYQRALEKVQSEGDLKEDEFRYPGPKPQTKETAIVLLADSVEASSRILSDPTPARIRGLVEKIINNKFIDGQLDECDLTLRDLNKISESFARVLTGVFHTRLEYPEMKTRKERNNAAKGKNKQSK